MLYSVRKQRPLLLGLSSLLASPALLAAGIASGPTSGYVWSETSGWINFAAADGDVQVYADHLEGYAWGENIGWIHLGSHSGGGAHTYSNTSASDYGVNLDASGVLSGYAWSETAGWISFAPTYGGVTLDASGGFSGYAWGENIGWIHFAGTATDSTEYQLRTKTPLYVNGALSDGNETGEDWANAFRTLQDALAVAQSGDQIWVAAGVYLPDEGAGQTADDRAASFTIPAGVTVYGGFAGGETALEARDWAAHLTILSGDIDGNDTNTDGNAIAETTTDIQGANAYHVVTISAGDTSTRLDGFTVTAGQASGSDEAGWGGGALVKGSPTLANLVLRGNSATNGGALYNWGAGGVASPTLINSVLSGNRATAAGGAIYDNGLSGGVSDPTLTNVTLVGNSATYGGAISSYALGGSSHPVLTNVIVWGNSTGEGQIRDTEGSATTLSYSLLQGGQSGIVSKSGSTAFTDGTGNLAVDPLFADASTGDLRPRPGSPAIDAGTATGAPTTDLRGLPRDATPDMGAYEHQALTLTASAGDGQSAFIGSPFVTPLEVSADGADGDLLDGTEVTFSAPASGASATFDPNPASITCSGDPTVCTAATAATANATFGSYQVSAEAGGASATFSLRNSSWPQFDHVLDVYGNDQLIWDGDTTPSLEDGTDFGLLSVTDETQARTFSIKNTSTVPLVFADPPISVDGDAADDFTVTSSPDASLAPNESTTFTLTFDPSGAGTRSASVHVAALGTTETYDFAVAGQGDAGVVNTAPTASTVTVTGTATVGATLTGRYTFSDADSDPEDRSASGTQYRWVGSADTSLATTTDNTTLASGATLGVAQTYSLQAADSGTTLFYCVTPVAATGVTTGTEACSAGLSVAPPAVKGGGITWTGEQFVLVGAQGEVMIGDSDSASGRSISSESLHGVAWSGQTLVAVGDGGVAYWSDDLGTNWSTASSTGTTALYGVTWGDDQFVAVGDHGSILTSANGHTWASQSSGTDSALYDVTWAGDRFVAVGDEGLVLNSADGTSWSQASTGVTTALKAVAWSGTILVAAGDAGVILTSTNGTTWTRRGSLATTLDLSDVAWSGHQFMAVGNDSLESNGSNGTAVTSANGQTWSTAQSGLLELEAVTWIGDGFHGLALFPGATKPFPFPVSTNPNWGDLQPQIANIWSLIGLPAEPDDPSIRAVLADDLNSGTYGTDWRVYARTNARPYVDVFLTSLDETLDLGSSYWVKHKTQSADLDLPVAEAAATPLVTGNPNCPSAVGCYEIPLTSPAGAGGLFNQISMPMPYPVGWWDVRIEVDGVAYAPSAASAYVNKLYWVWKGTGYQTYDDVTPGKIGVLQPWQGIQVEVRQGAKGHTLKLLIPALPKVSAAPAEARSLAASARRPGLLERLLEALIPSAAADTAASASEVSRPKALGEPAVRQLRKSHARTLLAGKAWSLHLRVRDGARSDGAETAAAQGVIGQLADAKAGYDGYDLPAIPEAQLPPDEDGESRNLLSLVFPHQDWARNAGDYTTDYRSTRQLLTGESWSFEIRSDQARVVVLRWDGPQALLRRSVLRDESSGMTYAADDPQLLRNGLRLRLDGSRAAELTWRLLGAAKPSKP